MTQVLAGAVLLVALAIASAVPFKHSTEAAPALLTPSMNVPQEMNDDAGARFMRFSESLSKHDVARPKLIALTFDDGPYPVYTPLLLDELHALNVPATFFLIGRDAEQWPELTRRIEANGDEIADHTYSHPNLDQESDAQVQEEVTHGRDALAKFVSDPAIRTLMRPPHGRYTVATLEAVQKVGYDVVLWTDDPGDWRSVSPETIESHVFRYATTPEIVLLHSGKMPTIEALPKIVGAFRAAGYTFVTAGELIQRTAPYALNHAARTPLSS